MKVIKRIIKVLLVIIIIVVIICTVDYFTNKIGIIDLTKSMILKEDDTYTDGNSNTFKPVKVEGILKEIEYTGNNTFTPLLYNNKVIQFPTIEGNIRTSHKDTVYSKEGNFYAVVSRDNKSKNKEVNEITVLEHKLGINKPTVVEVGLPKDNTVIYIQCYTGEALNFYNNYNWDSIKYVNTKYDFNKTDDELCKDININPDILIDRDKMYLEDPYLNIVAKNKENYEGYIDFLEYNNYIFNYYRTVGFIENNMKIEYARLTSLGYVPKEYGYYKGVHYIKFDSITLLGYQLTKNSSLIYYVQN